MIYVLAAVGAITIAVLLWRAFGPEPADVPRHKPYLAPDDNPDFLRRLNERPRDEDPPPSSP